MMSKEEFSSSKQNHGVFGVPIKYEMHMYTTGGKEDTTEYLRFRKEE